MNKSIRGPSHKNEDFDVQYIRQGNGEEFLRIQCEGFSRITVFVPMELIDKAKEDQWANEIRGTK